MGREPYPSPHLQFFTCLFSYMRPSVTVEEGNVHAYDYHVGSSRMIYDYHMIDDGYLSNTKF